MAIVSIVTAAATRQLTTIARAREVTGWSTGDVSDTLLGRLIDRASASIEATLGRRLARERVVERLRLPAATRVLHLSLAPVITLHSMTVNTTTIETTDLQIDSLETGRISFKVTTSPLIAYASAEPEPLFIVTRRQMSEFSIEYTGGYLLPDNGSPTLPAPIEAATISMVQMLKAATTADPLVQSERIGDAAWTYRAPSATRVPPEIVESLAAYRRAA